MSNIKYMINIHTYRIYMLNRCIYIHTYTYIYSAPNKLSFPYLGSGISCVCTMGFWRTMGRKDSITS